MAEKNDFNNLIKLPLNKEPVRIWLSRVRWEHPTKSADYATSLLRRIELTQKGILLLPRLELYAFRNGDLCFLENEVFFHSFQDYCMNRCDSGYDLFRVQVILYRMRVTQCDEKALFLELKRLMLAGRQ